MKIKFIKDAYVNGEHVFSAGKVYEIEAHTSAERWIRRGVAEVFVEAPQPKEETQKESVEAKKHSPKKSKKEQAEELL